MVKILPFRGHGFYPFQWLEGIIQKKTHHSKKKKQITEDDIKHKTVSLKVQVYMILFNIMCRHKTGH